jgi:hypothetical protein
MTRGIGFPNPRAPGARSSDSDEPDRAGSDSDDDWGAVIKNMHDHTTLATASGAALTSAEVPEEPIVSSKKET